MECRKFSRRVTEIERQDVQLASRMDIGKGVNVEIRMDMKKKKLTTMSDDSKLRQAKD